MANNWRATNSCYSQAKINRESYKEQEQKNDSPWCSEEEPFYFSQASYQATQGQAYNANQHSDEDDDYDDDEDDEDDEDEDDEDYDDEDDEDYDDDEDDNFEEEDDEEDREEERHSRGERSSYPSQCAAYRPRNERSYPKR